MTETADQTYFRAIEETFIRLRGAPLLLSPADWHVARDWHRRGVPLELVREALTDLFERRAERRKTGRVNSLRYCRSAVEKAWEEWQELAATGRRDVAPQVDLPRRLGALAKALPEGLPGRQSLAARIRSLTGDAARVERRLGALEDEVLDRAEQGLVAADRKRLEGEVESRLRPLRARMPGDSLDEVRRRLLRQAVRSEIGLPLLSLFSPDARERGAEPS